MMPKIKIWKPLENISGRYWLENMLLIDCNYVFVYKKHKEENIKIHVVCNGFPASFMYTNETYEGGYTHLDNERIKIVHPWCFYTVEDSLYLKKISDDSQGLSDIIGLKHYCIISGDERVDIIHAVDPLVKLIIDGKVTEISEHENDYR